MKSVDVLVALAAAVVAMVYGIVRACRSNGGRAPLAALHQRLAPGTARPSDGRHRVLDAHPGSLSATAILRTLNAEGGAR